MKEQLVEILIKIGLFFANCDGDYDTREKKFIHNFLRSLELNHILVTGSPSVVRSLPPLPVVFLSLRMPLAASRHAALTPLLMVTSSTCRTRAIPCSPTPARACTTPRMAEEAG